MSDLAEGDWPFIGSEPIPFLAALPLSCIANLLRAIQAQGGGDA